MSSSKTIIEHLAAFASQCTCETIPSDVIQQVKLCIRDAIECCISSESDIRKEGVFQVAVSESSDACCTLWGTSAYANPENAAFYNGVSGAISSRNDISRIAKGHPGSVIVPTVLSLGEAVHADGKTVLQAILVGYETMIRYGNTLRLAGLPNSLRGTAMCGSMAAALAAAVVLKLPEDQLASAASFAVHSSFGLNEWAWAGTGEDVLQNGWCCRNGIQSARLAQSGIPGARTIFEGPCGMLKAFHCSEQAPWLTENLGSKYHIMDVRFKEISACMNVQSAGQAAQALALKYPIDPELIQDVHIQVAAQSKNWPGCDNTKVENLVQAIMSIQFTVAQALVHKNCAAIRWAPPYDEAVTTLMCKCRISEEPSFTQSHYQRQSATVTVTMQDGQQFSHTLPDVITLTEDQVADKFFSTMETHFNKETAAALEGMIAHLEEAADIAPLCGLLHKQ